MINKIKTLKDAKYFIDNFDEYTTSVGEFTFKDLTLDFEGNTRILRANINDNIWTVFSFGNNWENEGKRLNIEELKKFIFTHRKDINTIIS